MSFKTIAILSCLRSVVCERAPKWGIGRRQKNQLGERVVAGKGGGGGEREGACGHSFDAAVPPPCNQPVSNMTTR